MSDYDEEAVTVAFVAGWMAADGQVLDGDISEVLAAFDMWMLEVSLGSSEDA